MSKDSDIGYCLCIDNFTNQYPIISKSTDSMQYTVCTATDLSVIHASFTSTAAVLKKATAIKKGTLARQ
jgi:hypothetical protein